MEYSINLNITIKSCLTAKELNNKLVVALYDIENNYSKLDWVDNDLEVIEYNNIDIIRLK